MATKIPAPAVDYSTMNALAKLQLGPVEVPASRGEEDRQEHSLGVHVLRAARHCSHRRVYLR